MSVYTDRFDADLMRDFAALYLAGSDVPIVAVGEDHPVESGVYFLFTPGKGLFYIGQSADISYRTAQHQWARRPLGFVGAITVPSMFRECIETAYIHALDPPLNRMLPRVKVKQHGWMVAQIRETWGAALEEQAKA